MLGSSRERVRIGFVGDVMLGRLVSREILRRTPESFWGDVKPLLDGADAVIANLECAITDSTQRWSLTEKVFHFGAHPSAIGVLSAANIKAVSLANNHILDFGFRGLEDTIANLDRAGVAHAGAGIDERAARNPALLDVRRLKVALFSTVDHEKPFAAALGRAGTAFVVPGDASAFPGAAEVAEVRNAGADLVVLSCHLGHNMVETPTADIRAYRAAALANGVDIVHGHSAHIFQGIERCGRGLILHDAGDFLDDYEIDARLRNDWSFFFLVDADKQGLIALSLFPVVLEFARVRRASAGETGPILERMQQRSRMFGASFEMAGDHLACVLR